MDSILYENYLNILRQELVPALGCTEPITNCLYSGSTSDSWRISRFCKKWNSVEIFIKNVKGVTVPGWRNERNGSGSSSWYRRGKCG